MVCSPARLAANRQNSLKSTGPSPEARLRTRANALKHGLTGAGVVLPGEDRDAVEERYDALFREFDPGTTRAAILVGRAAYLSVRLQRCQRYDVAILSNRVRHAVEGFNRERTAELNRAIDRLDREPELVVERLRSDPDGLDWMIDQWQGLRSALTQGDGLDFGSSEVANMHRLMGERFELKPTFRGWPLVQAMRRCFDNLDPLEVAGVPDDSKPEWARGRLLAIIDEQIRARTEEREQLDTSDLKLDQDQAVDRVLFDPSKEAILARRYEAATERSLLKSFRELDALKAIEAGETVEAGKDDSEVSIGDEFASKRRGSLASFFPIDEIGSEVEESRAISPLEGPPGPDLIDLAGRPTVEKVVPPPRIE